VEVVQGDVLSSDRLSEALRGVTAAYYLVHSMSGAPDFYKRDLVAANNFARAAHDASVQRIIYLGGLGDPTADLSPHLRSRQETGRVLSSYGVPVTEFRAAIIVGAGSASFEMVRYLTERLPVMICPRWVYTRVQPISIDEILQYLVDALRTPQSVGRILEIGGADVLTYGDMMLGYARVRGLRRYLIPVPVLTPSLSSYWVHWVTPIPADIARPLIEGLRNEVIVRDDTARRLFPHIEPVDYLTAVRRALASLNAGEVETAWSDALVNSCGDITPLVLETREGMIIEQRRLLVPATPEAAYHAFTSLGGERGWLYADWAWHLRGAVDRLIGGVGLRRGRRHPYEVRPGDALDFWRVEVVEPGRLLRLRAEMKLPGDAWLQYEALPQSDGRTLLVQTAFFAPKGLLGFLYWYGLLPAHRLIFTGLLRSVARLAQEYAQQSTHSHRNHRQKG
jgi:uncharacterized protein YbjT (DUF2867 family)